MERHSPLRDRLRKRLCLASLCRAYNNDDPSTSNFYAPLPYITEPRRIQMDQRLSDRTSVLASAAVGAWTTLVNSLRMLITIDVRTYQPEKYYMRGPARNGARSMLAATSPP